MQGAFLFTPTLISVPEKILDQIGKTLIDNRYMKKEPTEYDMLLDDEQTLLDEMDECKSVMINLESELQIVRDKLAFIKRAVPENIEISIHD